MDTEEQPDAVQNIQDREASTVSEEGRVEVSSFAVEREDSVQQESSH